MKPIWRRTCDGCVTHVVAVDRGRAAAGPQHRAQDPQRRRLAGAVGPKQAEDLPGQRVEADAAQRDELAAAQVGVVLRQVADVNHAQAAFHVRQATSAARTTATNSGLQLGPQLIAYLIAASRTMGRYPTANDPSRIGRAPQPADERVHSWPRPIQAHRRAVRRTRCAAGACSPARVIASLIWSSVR